MVSLSQVSYAKTNYGDAFVDRIISVYDGDTFRCDIKGYPEIVGNNISIRISGVDTPEMNDKRPHMRTDAKRARDYLSTRLEFAKSVELRNMQRGKYFRIVADVYIDGENVAYELIDSGLGRPYNGGTKGDF